MTLGLTKEQMGLPKDICKAKIFWEEEQVDCKIIPFAVANGDLKGRVATKGRGHRLIVFILRTSSHYIITGSPVQRTSSSINKRHKQNGLCLYIFNKYFILSHLKALRLRLAF